ncbi:MULTISPECIES: glycosyltransferase family 4 protein [Dyella]|uniref:Glycosyltransferase n=2 Tax=Dyella TaxID=231454 RepID=A0A4R0YU71_9GAMM|nr:MULTISPECIES: glycosyltransferase family 4 protein [Dyella]TBR39462.1 glycosyltransferase [Dyella terrae]TCI12953.1 glycosyltransferase [Dyella soli]
MKLALVVPGGVDRSGERRVIPALLALIERLARLHEVHVYALHQEPLPDTWMLAGAFIHNVGERAPRWHALRAIRHEHRRAPFDVIQAIFSGYCGLVAVLASRWLKCAGLVHIAGGELVDLRAIGYGGRRRLRDRWREAVILRGADAITAASHPAIDVLRSLGLRARRLPLGVDLRRWPPMVPRQRGAGPARLIHVANLNRVKDQGTLLQAMAILDRSGVDFQLDVVGVDTLDGETRRLAGQLGLDRRLQFHGFRTQRELRCLMERAHLLVMSSRHETGPVALLEAAVMGVPAVGTCVGHFAEWAPTAALAVPVGDADAIASAIGQVLGDEDLRLRLAIAAQRRAIVEDADFTARAFESLYLKLLTGGLR